MAQPKKPGLGLVIAIGGPKRGPMPPPPGGGSQTPQGLSNDDDQMIGGSPASQQPHAGGKSSREEAGYVPMEQACGACKNYNRETSECAKVEGLFRCCDSCQEYFEPANPAYLQVNMGGGGDQDQGEPDADDQGPQAGLSPGAY